MTINIGDKAPNFKLYNTNKEEIQLESYKGKNVVLLFFPLAFTGVCTTELCTMRDDITRYTNLNAEIIAISVDSLFTLERFKADQKLNFTLLSDFNGTTSATYGSLYDDFVLGMKNVSKRSAFVIDANGVVQYAEVLDSAGDLPNFSAVNATLEKLNTVSST